MRQRTYDLLIKAKVRAVTAEAARPRAEAHERTLGNRSRGTGVRRYQRKNHLFVIPEDKVELTPDNKAELSEFLKYLRAANKERTVVKFSAGVVTGHTDRVGSVSYNMQRSEHLAAATRDYLSSAPPVREFVLEKKA